MTHSADNVALDVCTALMMARSDTFGPVHLSIPSDIFESESLHPSSAPHPTQPPLPGIAPAAKALTDLEAQQLLQMLQEATAPVIMTGPHMSRGKQYADVQQLGSVCRVPVLPMDSAYGLNDPWLHGAAKLLPDADLVLLLGKRLDFSLKYGEQEAWRADCKFVWLSAHQENEPKPERYSLRLQVDPAKAVLALITAASQLTWTQHIDWEEKLYSARRSLTTVATGVATGANDEGIDTKEQGEGGAKHVEDLRSCPLHPMQVCAPLRELIQQGAVFVSEAGEFAQWTEGCLAPETRLMSGMGAPIGTALPHALGVKAAMPDKLVIATCGDGGFGYHLMEFDTAIRYQLPVLIVVGNDARWNAEWSLQQKLYGRTVATELREDLRYDKVVEQIGGVGIYVERAEQMHEAVQKAVQTVVRDGRPVCIHVRIQALRAPSIYDTLFK
eukprot:TRINITY_DN327_c0_g3_i3.p1 TRINITY_DN327_c0_g3~~TRINITY_DN327_c0_g3_i3.p1  ORF type:complete len:443 (+),score=100.75 TRINITY_DN327_c0_g3_i3:928-2256(+)